jgi:hypothetical protein
MGAGIQFQGKWNSAGQSTTFAYIGGVKENSTDSDYSGKLVFGTRLNGSAGSDMTRMTILASGNVGIGTTTPDFRLHVAGSTDLDTAILISTPGGGIGSGAGLEFKYAGGGAGTNRIARIMSAVQSGGGGDLLFQTAPGATSPYATQMTLLRSGNVGIGTATPVYLLDVAKSGASGTARFYDQTATTGATRVVISLGAADTSSTQVLEIGGLMKFSGLNSTGAGTALLGTNSPATTNAAPYTWFKVLTSDGSTGYIPVWK